MTEQDREALHHLAPHYPFTACMSEELKLTFLLGPLVFFILGFLLGLFTPCLNHGSYRFLCFFRIFVFLHGSWNPDLTALLCFTREKANG